MLTSAGGLGVLRFATNSFDGFIEVTGEDYGPLLVFFPVLVRDFVVRGGNPIPRHDTFTRLVQGLAPPLPDRATLLVAVNDCDGDRAAGVKVAIDPADGATPFYFAGGIPSPAATQTDSRGVLAVGGFVNVRTNTAITIRPSVVANTLAFAPTVAFVRPGPFSYSVVIMYAQNP